MSLRIRTNYHTAASASLDEQRKVDCTLHTTVAALQPKYKEAALTPRCVSLLWFYNSPNTPPLPEEGGSFIPPVLTQRGSIWQAAKMAKQTPLRAPFAHQHRQKLR